MHCGVWSTADGWSKKWNQEVTQKVDKSEKDLRMAFSTPSVKVDFTFPKSRMKSKTKSSQKVAEKSTLNTTNGSKLQN